MKLKELALFGGLANKAEAKAYQQIIPEETVLVSIISPNGIPITPLCYIPIGKSMLKLIETALEDPNHMYSIDPINVREPTEFDVVQATDLFSQEAIVEEMDITEEEIPTMPDEPVTELESVLNPESLETIEIDVPEEVKPAPKPSRKKKTNE